jgi:protein O-mannosyl-transferase
MTTAREAWVRRLLAGGLVLAGVVAYHNSFAGPFVLDDADSIPANPTIRNLARLGRVLQPPHGGFTVSGRPILNLSFAINYALGGTDVLGYHLGNLLIHICAGLVLFGILRRTALRWNGPSSARWFDSDDRRVPNVPLQRAGDRSFHPKTSEPSASGFRFQVSSFLIALLWLVHPLQTESVTYVVQRAESLMGLFYLLTLYCFIRYAENPSDRSAFRFQVSGFSIPSPRSLWAVLSVLTCLLGMATKEVMVSVPVIVFLYDRTFVSGGFREAWRRHRWLHLALASTWLLLVGLVLGNGSRGGTTGFSMQVPWWRCLLTQPRVLTEYLRLSVAPFPLVFDHGGQWLTAPGWELSVHFLTPLALVAGTLWALGAAPALGFCGAAFLAILAPTSLVPGARQTMAEHRMYLALAPELAVLVWAGARAAARLRLPRRAGAVVLVVVAVALLLLTIARNEVYRTDRGLWEDTIAKRPDNSYAHANLGVALLALGRPAEADLQLARALEINPFDPQVNYDYALLRSREGRVEEAMAHYRVAIQAKPDLADAMNNLGVLLTSQGRLPEAIAQLEEALRVNPEHVEAHIDLGNALAAAGRPREAMGQYKEALRLNPRSPQALANLGNMLRQAGQLPEAMDCYRRAISLDPQFADAHNDLAVALGQSGRARDAIAELRRAIELNPEYFEARENLGTALRDTGDMTGALEQFRAAVACRPGSPEAQNALGAALFQLDHWTEAIASYEEALRLRPDYPLALCNLGVALATVGRQHEAIERLSEAVRLDPGYAEGHSNLAVALSQAGRIDEIALRLRPGDARIRANLEAARQARDAGGR